MVATFSSPWTTPIGKVIVQEKSYSICDCFLVFTISRSGKKTPTSIDLGGKLLPSLFKK
jgi:hypothetical protein